MESKPDLMGDGDFDSLVLAYVNDIRKLIYSYVKNHQTMEDLTQEVFISAYRGFETFRGESSAKTWLFKIAINKCKDHLKSWHHRQMVLTEIFQERSRQKSLETELIESLEKEELAAAIMSIPLKYREIIVLYYYHEMGIPEIGSLLNMNANTAKTRLARGREFIKRRYRF